MPVRPTGVSYFSAPLPEGKRHKARVGPTSKGEGKGETATGWGKGASTISNSFTETSFTSHAVRPFKVCASGTCSVYSYRAVPLPLRPFQNSRKKQKAHPVVIWLSPRTFQLVRTTPLACKKEVLFLPSPAQSFHLRLSQGDQH